MTADYRAPEDHLIRLDANDLVDLIAQGIDTPKKRALWITSTLDNALRAR